VCGVSRQCVQDWERDREKLERAKDDHQLSVKRRRFLPLDDNAARNRGKVSRLDEDIVKWIRDL
jgi:hypothetical protein